LKVLKVKILEKIAYKIFILVGVTKRQDGNCPGWQKMGWELSGVAERREGNCQGWTKDGRQIVQGSKKTEVELSGWLKRWEGNCS